MKRRITQQEREELLNAIEAGEAENATAFAEAYAAEHDLNANTVRAAITRLRRELHGGPLRPRPAGGGISAQGSGRAGWFAQILMASPEGDVAEVGAAALVRYEQDAKFKSAVDQRKAETAKLYSVLQELRAEMKKRPGAVQIDLIYALRDSAKVEGSRAAVDGSIAQPDQQPVHESPPSR
jgi:hypothetical protein